MSQRHREVPSGEPAFGEKRRKLSAAPGCAFFWFLFFAQTKKRNPPAVREPQLAVTHRRRRFNDNDYKI
jgi:hypothetical protein